MKLPNKNIPMSGKGHEATLQLLASEKVEHLDHLNVCGGDYMFIDIFESKQAIYVSIGYCDGHASEAEIIKYERAAK